MKRRFKTNSRLLSEILADYSSTFSAFCELINNSIQARAKVIDVEIDAVPESALSDLKISKISIKDYGDGVPENEFDKSILEVATNVKSSGKGIGRFAAFQMGSTVAIETVSFDESKGKHTLVKCVLTEELLRKQALNETEIDTTEQVLDKPAASYYKVTITNFYPSFVVEQNKKRRVSDDLLPARMADALFQRYPNRIFNGDIQFKINKVPLKKDDFVIGTPEKLIKKFKDNEGKEHNIYFTYYNVKKSSSDVKVFITVDNSGIQTVAHTFDFNADWLSPKLGAFFIYIESRIFTPDIFRNLDFDMDDNTKALKRFLKEQLSKNLNEKNKEFEDFAKNLKKDKYYPYLTATASSKAKEVIFDKFAYLIEDKYFILKNQDELRSVIYSLIDKSISNGRLEDVLKSIVTLSKDNINKFSDLLKKTAIENVIEFSEHVATKNAFLDILHELTYGDIAKKVKERSELHKMIEKQLWIFGERYADTPFIELYSDKNLRNSLDKLREKHLTYVPKEKDKNLDCAVKGKAKSITDLLFYNEKILDNEVREIMIVELKAPKCKIGHKEISQVEKYANDILSDQVFPREYFFKIILVSSHFSDYAVTEFQSMNRPDPKNRFCYRMYNNGQLEIWILSWMDLIEMNRKKLSYLGNALKISDSDVATQAENELSEIRNDKVKARFSKAGQQLF